MVGGIVNSRIAGKWFEQDAELKHLFRTRKDKARKKVCNAIFFCFKIAKIQQILLPTLLNRKFFINNCMVVSYSGYPERSVSYVCYGDIKRKLKK